MINIDRSQLTQAQAETVFLFVLCFFPLITGNRAYRRAHHVEAMCYMLDRVARGEVKRLIISVPPRHLKSATVAIAFVAWYLGHHPEKKIIVASYGADLAAQHARGFRAIIEDPNFKRLFPKFRVRPDRNTADETVTTLGGGRKAVSVGGSVTGFGADVLIIDDLLKASDARSELVRTRANEYFDETLYSRLDIKSEGVIIVIQQRLHEDDLVGHLLEQGGWEHMRMPSVADRAESYPLYMGRNFQRQVGDLLVPHIESHAVLEETRKRLGEIAYNAQYLLDPRPPEGHLLDWNWFYRYEEALPRADYTYVVQSWDTATTDEPNAAFSVCLTFGYDQGKWELLDVLRERLIYPRLRQTAKRLYQQWRPDRVLIEDASSGRALIQDMLEDLPSAGRRQVIPIRPFAGKEERFNLQTAKIEQGLIALPDRAPWLAAFEHELKRFPLSTYCDQVDALSQFLEWSGTPQGRRIGLIDPATGRMARSARPRGMTFPGSTSRGVYS